MKAFIQEIIQASNKDIIKFYPFIGKSLIKCQDINELSLLIFNNPINKTRSNLISQLIQDSFQKGEALIYLISQLSKLEKDHNKIYNFINNFNTIYNKLDKYPKFYKAITHKNLSKLNHFFSFDRISKMITTTSTFDKSFYLDNNHILELTNKLELIRQNEKVSRTINKKQYSFQTLYKNINESFVFIKNPDFNLNISSNVKYLDKQELNEFYFFVPKTKHDLIRIGNLLNNCVGSKESYSNGVINNEFHLITLCQDKKPLICVKFNQKRIIEIRGKDNSLVDFDSIQELREFLQDNNLMEKHKEIQLESTFLKSYRYNKENQTLFLRFKNNKVYEYPNTRVEELLEMDNAESAGSFFHGFIKRKYKGYKYKK